jgi:hypothetical protein
MKTLSALTHLDDQLKAFELWESWTSGKRGRTR